MRQRWTGHEQVLDICYIFDQEPIEPDSKYCIGSLPDLRLVNYIKHEIPLAWELSSYSWSFHHGNSKIDQVNPAETYYGDMHLAFKKVDHYKYPQILQDSLTNMLHNWRFVDNNHILVPHRFQWSSDAVWAHLVIIHKSRYLDFFYDKRNLLSRYP